MTWPTPPSEEQAAIVLVNCIVCYEIASFFYSDLACRVKMMYTIVISLLATSTIYSVAVTALSPPPHAKLLYVCVCFIRVAELVGA